MDPQQNNVQFEESRDEFAAKAKMPSMNMWVVKAGLAKDERGSNKVLIVLAIIAILTAAVIYAYYVMGWNPFQQKVSTPSLVPIRAHRNAPVNQ